MTSLLSKALDDDVRRIADRLEPKVRRAFLEAIASLKASLSIAEIENLLESGALRQLAPLRDEAIGAIQAALVQTASEAGTRVGVSFELINPRAVRWAQRHAAELVTQVDSETQQALRRIITRGQTSGLNIRSQARLIRETVGLTARDAMAVQRFAEGLADNDIPFDSLERQTERYSARLLRRRAENIARTECLPGSAVIDGARATAIHRRFYTGEWVEVVTESGRQFSGTPNHPVLTVQGWKGLGELTESDSLICDSLHGESVGASRDKNIQGGPATISEIFEAAQAVGIVERKRTRQPDFHGDGMDGYVDILHPHNVLLLGAFAPVNERRMEGVLPEAFVRSIARSAYRAPFARNLGVADSQGLTQGALPDSGLVEDSPDSVAVNAIALRQRIDRAATLVARNDGFDRQVEPVVRSEVVPLNHDAPGLGAASAFTGPTQQLADRLAVASDPIGNHRLREAGPIEVDDVRLLVRRDSFAGHVYNLSTVDGYFAANGGVYTGNTMTAANRGVQMGWQSEIDRGNLPREARKVWIATADERTCPLCSTLDGQIVDVMGEFTQTEVATSFTRDGESFRVNETETIAPVTRLTPPRHQQCRCSVGIV